MVKSIEPDVALWANSQLVNSNQKYAIQQGVIDINIEKALKNMMTKRGGDGIARPDAQLILNNGLSKIPVLIEYKGTKNKLEYLSKYNNVILKNEDGTYDFKKAIPNYAVNGSCYYASAVIKKTEFKEALAVGVNGYTDSSDKQHYEVKAYILNKKNPDLPILVDQYNDLTFLNKEGQNILIKHIHDVQSDPKELHDKLLEDDERLNRVLKKLNDFLRQESRIRTGQRIFVVAASIMAALGVKDNHDNYLVKPLKPLDLTGDTEDGNTDGDLIMRKVQNFLKSTNIPKVKQEQLLNALRQPIKFSNLGVKDSQKNESPLKLAYTQIFNYLIPAYHMTGTIDFTGKLFNIMNDWVDVPDGDTNDVVLTPRQTTDLMAKLTRVNMNSYVWDWALGSGGFLISAMNLMIEDVYNNIHSPVEQKNKITEIKHYHLLGIEKLPDIYVLAVLNMILMGDGSSNIINKNSLTQFDGNYAYGNTGKFPADVFLLNPPYSAEGNGMIFVEKALNKMVHGRAAVIVQDSAGNGKAVDINTRIMKKSRLIASIKMPTDLFKTNVQTSIYLFEVGTPQANDDIVKFIDFRKDGYTRTNRKKAASNLKDDGTAKERYDELIKVVKNGISNSKYLKQNETYFEDTVDPLSGKDWNFDQHIVVDPKPKEQDFYSSIIPYETWKITRMLNSSEKLYKKLIEQNISTDVDEFKAGDLFSVRMNPSLNKDSLTFSSNGKYPYFTRTVNQNGIAGYTHYYDDEHLMPGNVLVVGMMGMRFFYMDTSFYAGQFTRSIIPNKKLFTKFNAKIALYFTTILNKYSELYKGDLVRNFEELFNSSILELPVDSEGKLDLDYIEKYIDNKLSILVQEVISEIDK